MKENPLQATRELLAAVESERRRVGEEIHDTICQTLTGTTLLLETIGRAVAANKPIAPESFGRLKEVFEMAAGQAREMAQRFNPANLEGPGLMTALHEMAARIPNTEFVCEKPVFVPDPQGALALYRVAERGLDNVTRHAGASRIRIHLAQKDRSAVLTITDDGVGFIPDAKSRPFSGLNLMRMRAEAAAGTLVVRSVPGRGTTVVCTIPLRPALLSSG